MIKFKYHFLALILLVTQDALALSDTLSGVVDNKKISQAEINSLDPVCKLILIERPGIHAPVSQRINKDLFNKPEYEMAKDSVFLHHRCWALVYKHRYLSSRNTSQKNHNLAGYYADMGYVLQNSPIDWKFRPQMLVEVGTTRLLEGAHSKAIPLALEAIKFNKQFSDAYVLLADAHLKLNNISLATKAIQDGLEENSSSKPLRRRAAQLGIKIPDLKPTTSEKHSTQDGFIKNDTVSPESMPKKQNDTDIAPVANKTIDHPIKEAAPTPEDPGAARVNKPNPYCRFCP
jgi:hypothetical protein